MNTVPGRAAVSWDEVRAAHDRAAQMAVQTVEAYAAIGDMLIELKAQTAHGEFTQRCAEAFGKPDSLSQFSKTDIDAANQRASKYMRLATHRAAWLPHNPQSLNEAMKMLPVAREPVRRSAGRKSRTVDVVARMRPDQHDAFAKHLAALYPKQAQRLADMLVAALAAHDSVTDGKPAAPVTPWGCAPVDAWGLTIRDGQRAYTFVEDGDGAITLVYVEPSQHPGYHYVTRILSSTRMAEGGRRPVREDAIGLLYLQDWLGAPRSLVWKYEECSPCASNRWIEPVAA